MHWRLVCFIVWIGNLAHIYIMNDEYNLDQNCSHNEMLFVSSMLNSGAACKKSMHY